MEARQITIVSSRTQQKTVIDSTAETLGQLKADLSAAGIDYAGLSFFEGISKTELNQDDALLPKNLPWRGEITNNLVFMLTEPQKKIKNGVTLATRNDAYSYIQQHNLKGEVEAQLGSNFTRCKTVDLLNFCNTKAAAAGCSSKRITTAKTHKCTKVQTAGVAMISHEDLVKLLVVKGIISEAEAIAGSAKCKNTEFSDTDLLEMFKDLKG